jgi:phosphoheptose isomerase
VLGISKSGTSNKVLLGFQAAKAHGCLTIAFSGEKSADCTAGATLSFKALPAITVCVQESNLFMVQLLCFIAEQALTK